MLKLIRCENRFVLHSKPELGERPAVLLHLSRAELVRLMGQAQTLLPWVLVNKRVCRWCKKGV